MAERRTLKIKPDTKARLDDLKRDGETWDGLLQRAADSIDDDEKQALGTDRAPRCSDCGNVAHGWTIEDGMLLCGLCYDGEIDLPEFTFTAGP